MPPVEYREFAQQIVTGDSVEIKLTTPPTDLTDENPGEPLRLEEPGRPENLQIVPVEDTKVPSVEGYHDPDQRPRILHAFANHEFQAVELFAWAVLAYPDAPADFRSGLLRILEEEQRHTRMYIARLEAFDAEFGDYPVSGYFWNKTPDLTTPGRFVCAMALTFENANIDHTSESAAAVRRAGDERTARVIDQIHEDEIGHVRFGREWLERFKDPDQSLWEAYCANVTWPLRPALARGKDFSRRGRELAGLDEDFIERLEASDRKADEP